MTGLIRNGMILAKEVEGELWIKASLHNLEVKQAVETEREACAKVCEQFYTESDAEFYRSEFASAIRARGQG